MVLNLVMFGYSLIAALGTAFLAGPRWPARSSRASRWPCWPGRSAGRRCCSASGSGWSRSAAGSSSLAGLAQFLVVRATVDYWPPRAGRRRWPCSPAQTIVLLTLALLLSTVISPMASGVVAVGLFGTTWVAGVVGGVGAALGQRRRRPGGHRVADAAAHRRPVARCDARLPGPDRAGAVRRGSQEAGAFPFLSVAPLTAGLPRLGRALGGDGVGAGRGVLRQEGPVTAAPSSQHARSILLPID